MRDIVKAMSEETGIPDAKVCYACCVFRIFANTARAL